MRMLLPTLTSIANRRLPGASSRKSSRRLAAKSGPWTERPVTLPPGRERLLTNPLPTGSTARAKTIGIVDVACRDRIAPGHNDIDVGINKLCRNLGEAFGASLSPAIDYFNCVPVYPTMFAQPFFKGGNRLCPYPFCNSSKKPDYRAFVAAPEVGAATQPHRQAP